jgi:hypothetical protein
MGLLSVIGTIGGSLLGGGAAGGAIGGALGGLLEGSGTANAAQAAAGQTAAATNEATALQRQMYEEGVARQQPFYQAGVGAINRLAAGLGAGGEFGTPFSKTNFQVDPGYAFRLSEGQKALDRAAAARGGMISGAALKAAQRYGQDLGSQEYENAFRRYYTERENMLKPLQSLAGVGQTTAGTLGTSGQNYASNVGNALINQGYAAGNAGIAGANATNSMYGNIGNALGQVSPAQWSSLGGQISDFYQNLRGNNAGGTWQGEV